MKRGSVCVLVNLVLGMVVETFLVPVNLDRRIADRRDQSPPRAEAIADRIETGTVFMNRADYLDPGLCWTGCKDTGRGGGLSVIGYHNLTRPKSYHLKKA